MSTPSSNPEAFEAARRQLMIDMEPHVRGLLDEALPKHAPGDVLEMAVLIFEASDPFVHRLITEYVMPLPPAQPGRSNVGAAIIRRDLIPTLVAATMPGDLGDFDCTPILAALFIPVACIAYGGMTVAQQLPKPGLA